MEIQKEEDDFNAWFNKQTINAVPDADLSLQRLWASLAWIAAKAQAVPEWISVEDKLPKDGEYVLCIHEGGNQHVMMFTQRFKNRISWVKCFLHHDGCGQFQEFYDIGDYCEITHWMPLPDAPQEPAND